ncbi:MAG: hypothetical protein ACC667_07265 [Longimicrobiales bacterium]
MGRGGGLTAESPANHLADPSEEECRGLLISHIHDDFWSDDYYRAAQAVRGWRDQHREEGSALLFRRMEHLEELPEAERKRVVEVNAGRRLIKSCFRKTQQLCVRGFLSEEDLREHLTMPQRLKTLFEIIEPFEAARKTDYDREMFDFYDALHGGELDRPSR